MRALVITLILTGLFLTNSLASTLAESEGADFNCEELIEEIHQAIQTGEPLDEFLEEFQENCESLDDFIPSDCEIGPGFPQSAQGTAVWSWLPTGTTVTDIAEVTLEWGWADQGPFIEPRCNWIVTYLKVDGERGSGSCTYDGWDNGDQYAGQMSVDGRWNWLCDDVSGQIVSAAFELQAGSSGPCLFGASFFSNHIMRGTTEVAAGLCQGAGIGISP